MRYVSSGLPTERPARAHLDTDFLLECAEHARRDLLDVASGSEDDDGEAARLPSLPSDSKALLEHRRHGRLCEKQKVNSLLGGVPQSKSLPCPVSKTRLLRARASMLRSRSMHGEHEMALSMRARRCPSVLRSDSPRSSKQSS